MPLRVFLEKALEGLDPFGNAFGIVEPVDAQDQATSAKAFLHAPDQRRPPRISRHPGVNRGLDADGKSADPHPQSVNFISAAPKLLGALRRQITREVVAIVLRLKSDEIIVRQAAKDLPVIGQRLHNVGRGERDMKKESNLVFVPHGAQFPPSGIRW